MTTSKEAEWMNHPRLRKLVTAINELTLAERITLVKGLVPAIADELSDTEYERFVGAIRLKGERFHEAQAHPGEGRAERKIPGERDLEGGWSMNFYWLFGLIIVAAVLLALVAGSRRSRG